MKSITERKQRWLDAVGDNNQKGVLCRIYYEPDILERPDFWPDKIDERLQWSRVSYEKMLERCEWLDDDTVPHLQISTGTEIFAEAFGSQVHRAPGEMPFALPAARSAVEAMDLSNPDIHNSSLSVLFEIADQLRAEFGTDTVVQLPDIQSPMDIAALIVDKNQFYIDMITDPESVKAISARVRTVLVAFLDEWFKRYGTGYIAHYPGYYMEGGMTLSEDEIGAINQEMMEEFFLPELLELTHHFGGIGIHCCADARHHWEAIREIPGLRVLNLVQPAELVEEAYDFFGHRCLHYHQPQHGRKSLTWAERQPPPSQFRSVVEATAKTKDDALRLAEEMTILDQRDG